MWIGVLRTNLGLYDVMNSLLDEVIKLSAYEALGKSGTAAVARRIRTLRYATPRLTTRHAHFQLSASTGSNKARTGSLSASSPQARRITALQVQSEMLGLLPDLQDLRGTGDG